MNYCSSCGARVETKIPEGDTFPRFVCTECHTIHYQNPRIIAGTLPVWQDQVLLCKRAIAPRQGYWTLPAGFWKTLRPWQQVLHVKGLSAEACIPR